MAKHNGIFVTGTDTGVGKTVVSCALLQALNKQGMSTVAMKPVASGAEEINGAWANEDALHLQQAASVKAPYQLINPYLFEPPIAPHIAARQAGVEVDLNKIKAAYTELSSRAQFNVVEGVGGWLVPLNEHQTVADLAVALDLPVVLVVGMRLGCLNHALLTVENIRQKGAHLLGWIANNVEPGFPFRQDNIESLEKYIQAPLLAVMENMDEETKLEAKLNIDAKVLCN